MEERGRISRAMDRKGGKWSAPGGNSRIDRRSTSRETDSQKSIHVPPLPLLSEQDSFTANFAIRQAGAQGKDLPRIMLPDGTGRPEIGKPADRGRQQRAGRSILLDMFASRQSVAPDLPAKHFD
jgi:hypothetical protein